MKILDNKIQYVKPNGQNANFYLDRSIPSTSYYHSCTIDYKTSYASFECYYNLMASLSYKGTITSISDIVMALNPSNSGKDFIIPATGFYKYTAADKGTIEALAYGMTPESIEPYIRIYYRLTDGTLKDSGTILDDSSITITGSCELLYTS